jgi:hypothetical protein
MNPLELYEAYSAVYAPQEVDEEQLDEISDRKVNAVGRARQANVDKSMSSNEYISDAPGSTQKLATNISKMNRFKHLKKQRDQRKEEFDIFDVVLEFLYVEGYAETLEEAEWMMANIIDEEAIAIVLGEAITSEKGKAKAAEMIAARSTPSGRAKSGQGANVATIKHIGRSNRDGLLGTPPNRKVAGSNWPKSYTGIGGTGNKAARRAGTYKESFELWVNELVEEGYDLSDYTWDDMFDIYEAEGSYGQTPKATASYAALAKSRSGSGKKVASKHAQRSQKPTPGHSGKRSSSPYHTSGDREKMTQKDRDYARGRDEYGHTGYDSDYDGPASGPGGKPKGKKLERQRKTGVSAESFDYVDESQHARENPEKYEREQAKKSAPVRGERTPMPPRGDKRREDFEKWYAKNVR